MSLGLGLRWYFQIWRFTVVLLSDAQKDASAHSRASATSGNNVGVSQTTSTRNPEKGKTVTSTTAGGYSDEDDSIERASILKSPLKGDKRLSSTVSWSSYTLSCF